MHTRTDFSGKEYARAGILPIMYSPVFRIHMYHRITHITYICMFR